MAHIAISFDELLILRSTITLLICCETGVKWFVGIFFLNVPAMMCEEILGHSVTVLKKI